MTEIDARVFSGLLLSVVVIAGCQTAKSYEQNPLTVAIPPGVTSQAVSEAMIQAFEARRWTVVEASPQRTVGTMIRRGYEAKAVLESDGHRIKILSDARIIDARTGKWKPTVPMGWLENLQNELEIRLSGRAARARGIASPPSARQAPKDQERRDTPVNCSSNVECPGVMICYDGLCRSM
jgi:hypothetical protein